MKKSRGVIVALSAITLGALGYTISGVNVRSPQLPDQPKQQSERPAPAEPQQPFATYGSGKKLLIYFHGAGETATTSLADPQKKPIFDALVARGYTVASSDARGNNWGSDQSAKDYVDLYNYLQFKNNYSGVYVIAQSMGGVDGLKALDRIPVRAWVGIYPLVNLNGGGKVSPDIAKAYPAGNYPTPAIKDYRIPMLIFHSPADTVVPKATNTDLLPGAEIVSTLGEHGDPSNFQTVRIVEFLTTY